MPPLAQAASQQARFLAGALKKRLDGGDLPPFEYHHRGSLVSLSSEQAIGNIMGGAIRCLTIEGTIARIAYASLHKRHQAALYGPFRTTAMTVGNWLTRPTKPRLKLH